MLTPLVVQQSRERLRRVAGGGCLQDPTLTQFVVHSIASCFSPSWLWCLQNLLFFSSFFHLLNTNFADNTSVVVGPCLHSVVKKQHVNN